MTYDELEKAVENNKGYAFQLAHKLNAALRVIEEQRKAIVALDRWVKDLEQRLGGLEKKR